MRRSALLASWLLITLFDPARLAGQALPRTGVFEIEPPKPSGPEAVTYEHREPVALAFDGGFAVSWSTTFSPQESEGVSDSVEGRLLNANGRLGARLVPDSAQPGYDNYVGSPSIAREVSGDLLVAWCGAETLYEGADVWMQRFSPSGEPETPERQRLGEEGNAREPAAAAGGGISVIAWVEHTEDRPKSTLVKARVFATDGTPVTGELLLDTFPQSWAPVVAGVDAGGRYVILWWEMSDDRNTCTVRGQRFAPDGTALKAFTVGEAPADIDCDFPLRMAMAPDGSFAAAWRRQEGSARVQRFQPRGTPEGASLDVSATFLSLAGDRHGNLALMRPEGIQLLNRHLVAQGALAPAGPLAAPWMHGVALGDRLLAVWTGPRETGARASILGRIWDVRRDADACVYRGSRFLCDTAGDGGEPDLDIPFGPGSAVPLLGDFNGDGRDDPCLYTGGRFLCDTAHDGGLAEKRSPRFGRPVDVPLLGDLDGDGRDDPCLFRNGRFLCDSDRNGKVDRSIAFGTPGDAVVIGDVDGDHRDEPCVVRDGRFLCDTARNGGGAETRLILGMARGTPALGDVDGDGRDDPCVFTESRVVCGLFPKGSRFPASIVDRAFGEPGDVFLLGDLDAF